MKILQHRAPLSILIFCVALLMSWHALAQESISDMLILGDTPSESTHTLKADISTTAQGGLGEPSRILPPPETASWEGGKITFKMKVDPVKANYFTAKFWSSEINRNFVMLFCEGKQIDYSTVWRLPHWHEHQPRQKLRPAPGGFQQQ